MSLPQFSLVLVATQDGFIARQVGHSPAEWASPEEQALFFETVDAADWAVMGRGTHDAADKPHRRRIVFSRSAPTPEWRRPSQVWVDPTNFPVDGFEPLVADVHPMKSAVILGGTTVHDWFLDRGLIAEVLLTVEPVQFGSGLPIFSKQRDHDPERVIQSAGFDLVDVSRLNDVGTRLLRWARRG